MEKNCLYSFSKHSMDITKKNKVSMSQYLEAMMYYKIACFQDGHYKHYIEKKETMLREFAQFAQTSYIKYDCSCNGNDEESNEFDIVPHIHSFRRVTFHIVLENAYEIPLFIIQKISCSNCVYVQMNNALEEILADAYVRVNDADIMCDTLYDKCTRIVSTVHDIRKNLVLTMYLSLNKTCNTIEKHSFDNKSPSLPMCFAGTKIDTEMYLM